MKKPLLSICIPTYNREKYLKECLDNIIAQDVFSIDAVEIIISDNAGVDNTNSVVKSYQLKYPNIHYFRNDSNIGADRNVIRALQRGSGEYLWCISDDDILLPGSLKIVLKHLEQALQNNVWLIQTNFNVLEDGGMDFSKESYLGKHLKTKIFQDIPSLYRSYRYCHNGLSFMSIDIFKSEIQSFDLDAIPITQYPHSCIMGLISRKKAMFIAYNAIGFRQNNSSSVVNAKDFFRIFVINHLQYMKFLRTSNSSISQIQLSFILIKMILYTVYLGVKLGIRDIRQKIS